MSTSDRQTGTGRTSLLIVVKGKHKYLIKYDPARRPETLRPEDFLLLSRVCPGEGGLGGDS